MIVCVCLWVGVLPMLLSFNMWRSAVQTNVALLTAERAIVCVCICGCEAVLYLFICFEHRILSRTFVPGELLVF